MIQFLRRLWLIVLVLKGLLKMAKTIADKIDELAAQVALTVAGEASAIVYVNGVGALIQHAVDTSLTLPELQAKLSDLQAQLADSAGKMAAAVAAAPTLDTPVPGPTPTPAPAPAPGNSVLGEVKIEGTGTVQG